MKFFRKEDMDWSQQFLFLLPPMFVKNSFGKVSVSWNMETSMKEHLLDFSMEFLEVKRVFFQLLNMDFWERISPIWIMSQQQLEFSWLSISSKDFRLILPSIIRMSLDMLNLTPLNFFTLQICPSSSNQLFYLIYFLYLDYYIENSVTLFSIKF